MLDRYLWGSVTRISPEAPVPVVDVTKEENRLGGAANVAVNLHTLGATPILCGAIGADRYAELFEGAMRELGFESSGILTLPARRTTVKSRVIGGSQQMLRVDTEDKHPLTADEQLALRRHLDTLFDPRPDAIVFEDYDKGLLDSATIQHVVRRAGPLGIPVFVDPKFRNFFHYAGASVFKPNVKELNEAMNRRHTVRDVEAITATVHELRGRMPHRATLVTLSENGLLWVPETGPATHVPAHYRQIVDVSGAGDTVIATLAALMAAGAEPLGAAQLANLAGGLVCERVGVVPIEHGALKAEAQLKGLVQ